MFRHSNPGVICLQETNLGPEMFNLQVDYDVSVPPAGDRTHGAAAIIVSKSTILCCMLLQIYRLLFLRLF